MYLDWRTQEVGIAAALSGDRSLMCSYAGGDVYYAFARESGLTNDPDPNHWKAHDATMRQRMKALQLAVNYGMGVASLAKGLGQRANSDGHMYASRSRFIPASILDLFRACAWPEVLENNDSIKIQQQTVDIGSRMRRMWI
jgi:hypothetical protein